ncbi:MAG: SurA N-terminal domain-containing protein [Brevinematia bacterium]
MMAPQKEFNWKRFWSSVVIILIALVFTISIFISYGGRGRFGKLEELEVIAEVNGKPIEFYANSPVIREYERLRNTYKTRTKEELLTRAVQNVVAGMLIEDFAKKHSLDINEEFVNKILEDNIINLTRKKPEDITSADVKMAKQNIESYLISSYLPTKIDTFITRIPKKSTLNFQLFKSIDDVKVKLNIVEFDELEFIRINELKNNLSKIEEFYKENYKEFAFDKINVEKLVFENRKDAYSYLSNQTIQPIEVLSLQIDPEKSKNIISGLPDNINNLSKPFYENKKYVIYKVKQITPLGKLPQSKINYISLKYVILNYKELEGKYLENIKSAIETIKILLSQNKENQIAQIPSAKLHKSDYFSAIFALTEYIPNEKGEAIDLPRGLYKVDTITSFFKKNVNDVELVDVGQQTKVIYKVVSKNIIPSKVSEVADKISSAYLLLYQEAIFSDWNKMLEKSGNVKIKDISKFAKEL